VRRALALPKRRSNMRESSVGGVTLCCAPEHSRSAVSRRSCGIQHEARINPMARLDLQQRLMSLLGQVGNVCPGQVLPPKTIPIPARHIESFLAVTYQSLGGLLSCPPMSPGGWDIEFDGIALELDEVLHFNCYRGRTLQSDAYSALSGFPMAEYVRFCVQHEGECSKAGSYLGKWTNPSTARQFGPPAACGELSGNGSPRWKQRAFYDFMKDALPLVSDLRVARLAVWDVLDDGGSPRAVKDILLNPVEDSGAALAELVRKRAAH
jgi:hypothetical protein